MKKRSDGSWWSEKHKAWMCSFDGSPSAAPGFQPIQAFKPDSIDARFLKFHAENPQVYAKLVELCWRVRGNGFRKYSIRTIWETLRWHYDMEIRSDEKFKLNDQFTSRYARLLMQEDEAFEGLFNVRELTS
jgi:hypothetical protein